jgi:mannitol 2-dehydrogenase
VTGSDVRSQPLNAGTLAAINDRLRSAATMTWVHCGLGNFARAHVFDYQQQLRDLQPNNGWRYVAVGLREDDRAMDRVMAEQDNLYTLVHWDDRSSRARVVEVIDEYLFAPDHPERVIDTMAAPDCKIVSLTITEGAYLIDPVTGRFDATEPDVAHDLQRDPEAHPRSWVGYLVAALQRRRRAGLAPFAVMSCDNVQHNGEVARTAVLAFADLVDGDLRRWIAADASFPCTMVDRITPVTTDEHRTILAETYGVDDRWPVFSEPYGEWHVEAFDGARPALERVGINVADLATIEAHEHRKIRLLNGTHQALAHTGLLLGLTFVHEAMADADIAELATRLMAEEIAPCVGPVPGFERGFDDYAAQTRDRFANSRLADTLERVATDSWIRMTRFVFPSLVDQVEAGRPHPLLAFTVAAWLRALEHSPAVLAVVGGPYERQLRERVAGADADALLAIAGLVPEPILGSAAATQITDAFAAIGTSGEAGARPALRQILDTTPPRRA